jgi:hypothetical protein
MKGVYRPYRPDREEKGQRTCALWLFPKHLPPTFDCQQKLGWSVCSGSSNLALAWMYLERTMLYIPRRLSASRPGEGRRR